MREERADTVKERADTVKEQAGMHRKKGHRPRAARRFRSWSVARHCVQVLALLFFIAPVLAAGWSALGLDLAGQPIGEAVATPAGFPWYGTLSSSTVGPVVSLDPFAMLQIVAASKTFDASWLLAAAPPLIVFTLVRGRAFCGWVCPVNLLLEVLDALRRRIAPRQHLPERRLPRRAKIGVAAGVLVLSAVASIPVYELFNPIGFINKGLVFGSVAGGITLLAIVVLELFWGHRVWCRSLCPLGGFYELLGRVGVLRVRIDHCACTKCGACKRVCIADPEILDPAIEGATKSVCAGDCMVCGKCVEACPERALSMGPGLPR